MKRKFLSLILCFTILFTNINKIYADSRIAPAIPIVTAAPQVISSIGALMVMCGVKYVDYKSLNYSIRQMYQYEDFEEKILPSIESCIAKSVEGVVTFSEDIVSWFKDKYFPTVEEGTNGFYSNFPCYFPSAYESKFFNPGGSAKSETFKFNISPTYDVVQGVECFYDLGNGLTIEYSGKSGAHAYVKYKGKSIFTRTMLSNYLGQISFIYFEGTVYPLTKYSSGWGASSTKLISKINDIDSEFTLDVYSWDNVGSKPQINEQDKEIAIPIPGDVNDLIDSDSWSPSKDKVWNGTDSITIPTIDKPLVNVGDDILTDTDVDTGTGTDTDTDTDTGTGNIPGTSIPSFPSFGEELDFSPLYMTNIKDKFPFSLPWDFKNLINMFDVDPVAPKFELPFLGNNITLDFSYFEEWALIIRFFISISFTATLIFISTKMKG